MSAENLEIVQSLQSAMEGDLVKLFVQQEDLLAGTDATPDLFDPEFEAEWVAGPQVEGIGFSRRGVEGLRDGWRDWLEAWTSYELENEEYLDAGDKVVALVRIIGRTKTGDVEMEHTPAAVWTFRDGKIASIRFHLDRDQALEEAGLKPAG